MREVFSSQLKIKLIHSGLKCERNHFSCFYLEVTRYSKFLERYLIDLVFPTRKLLY